MLGQTQQCTFCESAKKQRVRKGLEIRRFINNWKEVQVGRFLSISSIHNNFTPPN